MKQILLKHLENVLNSTSIGEIYQALVKCEDCLARLVCENGGRFLCRDYIDGIFETDKTPPVKTPKELVLDELKECGYLNEKTMAGIYSTAVTCRRCPLRFDCDNDNKTGGCAPYIEEILRGEDQT